MEPNKHYIPVTEATPGKVTNGSILTCKGCRFQVIVTRGLGPYGHRWWEKIGWGKVGASANGKGYLYCPTCYPTVREQAITDTEG